MDADVEDTSVELVVGEGAKVWEVVCVCFVVVVVGGGCGKVVVEVVR